MRALVIGAGIGGLTAATALGQRGIEVDVVEQRLDTSVVGVGINQPPNALKVARSIGVLEACLDQGFAITGRAVHDHHGQLLVEGDIPDVEGFPASNGLSRKFWNEILLDAARAAGAALHYGTTVSEYQETADAVEVTLSDGQSERYDVIAAFDGIRSTMRRQLFGDRYEPVATGYGAFRVTLPRPPELTRIVQFIGPTNKAGLIPLSDGTMYLFLVVPAAGDWRPEPSELVELLRTELAPYTGLIGELRETIQPDANTYFSLIEEVLLTADWSRGRILLAGDAAHASAPHLTQGGAQAQEDALALALELVGDLPVPDALSAVVGRRAPAAALAQRLAHTIMVGEMNYDPAHRAAWPERYRELMLESAPLVTDSVDAPLASPQN